MIQCDTCVDKRTVGGGPCPECVVTLFTNAPPSYDYPQNVDAGDVRGARVLDCPKQTVEYQIGRNRSGLYWATTDIEKAAELRTSFPYEPPRSPDFVSTC